MNSTATSLFTVLIITHLTNQGLTAPIDPPATTGPYSTITETTTHAKKNGILKISINTFDAEVPKIGDKPLDAVNPKDAKDLEKLKEQMDRINDQLRKHVTLVSNILLIFLVIGAYNIYQNRCRVSKHCHKKHTKKGEILASGDNPKEKLPPYTQFAQSSYINVENSTVPAGV